MWNQGKLMTSTQFRTVVEPILAEYFDGVYDQRTREWKGIFKEKQGIARDSQIFVPLYGFQSAPIVQDGAPLTYDTGGTGNQGNYKYLQVGLGFSISEIALEDGAHIDLVDMFTRHLMQSMYETEELQAADVFNTGFSQQFNVTGLDGQPLFSQIHNFPTGTTYSNVLASGAQLSYTSLTDMLVQISQARDSRGKRIKLKPKYLVVPPALRYIAETILQSALRSDTSNNAKNVIGADIPEVKVITRLTSPTAWYIVNEIPAEDLGLVRYNRNSVKRKIIESDHYAGIQVVASERYVFSFCDPQGVYASNGLGVSALPASMQLRRMQEAQL